MSKQQRRKNRSNRQQRGKALEMFAKPVLRELTQSAVKVTLESSYELSTVTGSNGFLIDQSWSAFVEGVTYSQEFRYFEVLGWKIEVTLPSLDAFTDSFYTGAVAIYPVNWVIESGTSNIPADTRAILVLPGSVNCQFGVKNNSSWFNSPVKQVYSTAHFSTTNPRKAFQILGYFDNVGAGEYPCYVNVKCNVKMYGTRFPDNTPITLQKFTPTSCEPQSTEEIVDDTSSKGKLLPPASRPTSKGKKG